MGVYIKGMEMPKDHVRVLVLHPDGRVIDEWGNTYQAMPLPPHGRLIDSNAFVRSIRVAIHYDASRGREYISAEDLHEALTNAPTIIPAEEAAK